MMQTVVDIPSLKNAINQRQAENSLSLTFIGPDVSAADLLAIRQASRLTDTCLCALTGDTFASPAMLSFVQEAGVDILYTPKIYPSNGAGRYVVPPHQKDATFFLETVLAVLPLTVSVSTQRGDFVHILQMMETQFDGLFELITQEHSEDVMTHEQRQLRGCLNVVRRMAEEGETRTHILEETLRESLKKKGFGDQAHIRFMDKHTQKMPEKCQMPFYLTVSLSHLRLSDGIAVGQEGKSVQRMAKTATFA